MFMRIICKATRLAVECSGFFGPIDLSVSYKAHKGWKDRHVKKFSKNTPEQIVAKLEQIAALRDGGAAIAQACREVGISEATFHRWQREYGTMSRTEARELKQLRDRVARLERLLGQSELEKAAMRELIEGKF